jgi:hypothetical protein
LQPRGDIDHFAVQIGAVGYRIAYIDPDPETDCAVGRLVAVVDRDPLLDLNGTAYGAIYAVEHDQEGVAACIYDPPTVFFDGRINHVSPEPAQSVERSQVVLADQSTIADHVGIHDGDKPSPVLRSAGRI